MTLPPLPKPITVDGNRLVFTRAQMIFFGNACFNAGRRDDQDRVQTPTPTPKPPRDSGVDELMNLFGMTK